MKYPVEKGFSLVEIFVSLFVLTIASYMLIIKTNDYFLKIKFNANVYFVRNVIQKVRVRAILNYETLKISFGKDKIEILKHNKNGWNRVKIYNFPNLNLKSNNSPVFYPCGTVSKLFTLYIISENGIKKITMNINGRIKIY